MGVSGITCVHMMDSADYDLTFFIIYIVFAIYQLIIQNICKLAFLHWTVG